MVKKVVLVGLGVALLVTLLFGTRVTSYTATAIGQMRQRIDDTVPVEFKLKDARNQLAKLDPEVNQMKYEFARQQLRVDRLQEEVVAAREGLDEQLAGIVRLKDHLDSGETMFVSRDRSYSVTEVQADLKRRWDLYKTSQAIVDTKAQVLTAQQAGLDAARQKIAETESKREQLEVEIAQLEARMKLVEVAKTASDLHFDDSRISRLRESLDDIRSRIEVEEHLLDAVDGESFNGIPLEEEVATGDVINEIDAFLSTRSAGESLDH
jgi:peptidoglycan hydrolase CwlO-like protein